MAATTSPTRVGFVGLGAMGLGMATNLNKNPEYTVVGYDIWQPSADKFVAQGGKTADSPRAVAAESDFLVCMVASAQQADSVLFDETTGAVAALPQNALVLICSTVPASYHETLPSKLAQAGRDDILVIDSPVSGGTIRAAAGTLTIFASGPQSALQKAAQLLAAMSEKLYIVPGPASSASKIKTVNQLLVGTHIAAAAEAMGLAARMGLNTRQVYNIITNAAGNSWAFENRVPHMLEGDWTPLSALDIFVKDMGIVVSTGRELQFPLPLASTAEQLYTLGKAMGHGREDDSGLVRVFLPGAPTAVRDAAVPIAGMEKITPVRTPLEISKVGFVGLGAMGAGMASSLVRAGFAVHGYDVYQPAIDKFVTSNASTTAVAAPTPVHAAKEAQVFVVMVQNAAQADEVLFGAGKAADALPDDATVVLCSTVPPAYIRDLETRLTALGRGLTLVDAPVSGGVARAAKGDLTIICSGQEATLSQANGILLAMSGVAKNLCHVSGGVGAASSVKLINQLLAGVHIAAAAEAMAFAARLGLDTRATFDILCNAAAWSWMLENRAPQMLNADWTPHSALAIFVKDLGIVLDEARRLSYYSPISAAAHNLYLAGAAHGWTKESDAGVVRFWELMTGVSVSGSAGAITPTETLTSVSAEEQQKPQPLPAQATLDSLPKEYSEDVLDSIRSQVTAQEDALPVLVVLDDDPTGTQTCHDINVLMAWDSATLKAEFETNSPGFFILTNSRALPGPEAKQLILEICKQVKQAAEALGKKFEIVLRGDSTLRGHLPEEPEAAEEALGQFDGWVLAPFFFQGGRYTINDVHYVKEGDTLVPAHQTPFAQDATFGYKNSNLRRYIQEKCGSRFANQEDSFLSITIEDIREGGPTAVAEKLLGATSHKVIVVNAAAESDMHVFVAGLLQAERQGRRYLFRTGAAFVSSRLGIRGIPPLSLKGWKSPEGVPATSNVGGLILAGSYVPKTTAQLAALRQRRGDKLHVVELEASQLIESQASSDALVDKTVTDVSAALDQGSDVLVMTSRGLITGGDALSSLQIGSKVAAALVRFLSNLETRPRYVIAKGGITSSDAATKGLLMKKARVVGQAAPGVPLWVCHEQTSRHVGVPYVVFPGNVGQDGTLADIVEASSL